MVRLPRNVFSYLALFLLGCLLCAGPALPQEDGGIKKPFNQYGIQTANPYVVDRFVWNGRLVDKVIVPSRPPGIIKARAVNLPVRSTVAGINSLSNVPALEWAFGCSATSAAMMFGYYDNIGYSNMYSGLTNGGVFPMTNAAWPHVTISGEDRAQCPLSATRSGLDGRAIYGHVDDYWVMYGNSDPDPFIGNWAEHIQGECTADYMGTSQSAFGNTDGSTSFYYYPDGARLFDYTGSEPADRDGCHGLKLFVESRGYQVVTNFSQYIYGYNGNTQGFTFAEYKAEIDAGRPVLIHVVGHTMLGFGYNDAGSIVYLHNTWDNSDQEMPWGGSYSGMAHYGVTVLHLAPSAQPSVTTTAVTNITANSAESGGNIISEGGASVTDRGVCWSTSSHPTTGDTCTDDGTGAGSFTSTMTGLIPGTTYHVRAYATNSEGTSYGGDVAFSTNSLSVPTLTTTAVTNVTINSAESGGNVTSEGGASVTGRGVCWGTSPDPTTANTCTDDGTGAGSFTSTLTGLTPDTTYHVRAYATNSEGASYGGDVTFSTNSLSLPTVTTTAVTSITTNSAVSGGDVTSDGGSSVTERGVCWSTSPNPTTGNSRTQDGTGVGDFSCSMTGLTADTTYHVRAYATNSAGTAYGEDLTFSTDQGSFYFIPSKTGGGAVIYLE